MTGVYQTVQLLAVHGLLVIPFSRTTQVKHLVDEAKQALLISKQRPLLLDLLRFDQK